MHIEIPIHLWHDALVFETRLFKHSVGRGIVRMGERLDFSEPETFEGKLHRELN
jgi:hypothetical protein